MTTASLPRTAAPGPTTAAGRGRAETNLRRVLLANAVSSGIAGVAGLAAADWWAETLGVPGAGWVAVISAGLAIFAVEVGWVATRATRALRPAALGVSVADVTWVVGTVVVVATVDLTTTGWVLAVVLGVVVSDFALLQLWFRRRVA